jgi:hypothetical protein
MIDPEADATPPLPLRRIALRAAGAAALVTAILGGITWLALEGGDVAVLRTHATGGGERETHVWVARVDDTLWIEAATPERSWLRDVEADPRVELRYHGTTRRYRAVPEPGPEAHARIRRLLRAKYGWADQWVALLQDTSRSVAVRLEPAG